MGDYITDAFEFNDFNATDIPGEDHMEYTNITSNNIYACVNQYLNEEDTILGRLKHARYAKHQKNGKLGCFQCY